MVNWERIGSAYFDQLSKGMEELRKERTQMNAKLEQFRMKSKHERDMAEYRDRLIFKRKLNLRQEERDFQARKSNAPVSPERLNMLRNILGEQELSVYMDSNGNVKYQDFERAWKQGQRVHKDFNNWLRATRGIIAKELGNIPGYKHTLLKIQSLTGKGKNIAESRKGISKAIEDLYRKAGSYYRLRRRFSSLTPDSSANDIMDVIRAGNMEIEANYGSEEEGTLDNLGKVSAQVNLEKLKNDYFEKIFKRQMQKSQLAIQMEKLQVSKDSSKLAVRKVANGEMRFTRKQEMDEQKRLDNLAARDIKQISDPVKEELARFGWPISELFSSKVSVHERTKILSTVMDIVQEKKSNAYIIANSQSTSAKKILETSDNIIHKTNEILKLIVGNDFLNHLSKKSGLYNNGSGVTGAGKTALEIDVIGQAMSGLEGERLAARRLQAIIGGAKNVNGWFNSWNVTYKKIKEKMTGLRNGTPAEQKVAQKFSALTHLAYGLMDDVLRARSGAAISVPEMENMKEWIPDLDKGIPDFITKLVTFRKLWVAKKGRLTEEVNRAKEAGVRAKGYRLANGKIVNMTPSHLKRYLEALQMNGIKEASQRGLQQDRTQGETSQKTITRGQLKEMLKSKGN